MQTDPWQDRFGQTCDIGAATTDNLSSTRSSRPATAPAKRKSAGRRVFYQQGIAFVTVPPKPHSVSQVPGQILGPNRCIRSDDGQRTVKFANGDIGFANVPSESKKSDYSDNFSRPRSSTKGGAAAQKRAGGYDAHKTRNLVDHRSLYSNKMSNGGRFSVERNKSSVQLGEPDPKWNEHQKCIRKKNSRNAKANGLTLNGHQRIPAQLDK